MPRVVIKTLPLGDSVHVPDVILHLGRVLEKEIGLQPYEFVIVWDTIPANCFLFNGELAGSQPESTHYPMIDVTALDGMPRAREKAITRTLVSAISQQLNVRPDNVCVTFNFLKSGRLFVAGDFKKAKMSVKSPTTKPGDGTA